MEIFYDYIFWIMMIALSFHLLEEHLSGFLPWVHQHLNWAISPAHFFTIHAFKLIIFTLFAILGWMIPILSLAGAAIFFIDTLILHVALSLRKKSLMPGTISALLLLLPLSFFAYFAAKKGGVPLLEMALSFLIGSIVILYPFFMLLLHKKLFVNICANGKNN